MMDVRNMMIVAGMLLVLAATGCQSQPRSQVVRENARSRVGLMNARLTYEQAMRHFEVGRLDEALRNIDMALQTYDEEPRFHLLQGRILLEKHLLERALRAFDRAVELDPNNHQAHYFAGIVYQRWSDDQRAFERYQEASTIEPSNAQYLLAAAESLVALGELDAALDLVKGRLAYFEHNAALHHLQAQIAMLQGRYADAAKLYTRVRLLNPDDEMLLDELLRAQYAAGHFGQCLESIEQVRTMSGMLSDEMELMRARCLAMLDRTTESRDLYIKITRAQPTNVPAWSELGMISWEMGDFNRVLHCSRRLQALAPDRFDGYLLEGVTHRHAGRHDEAVAMFQAAAERSASSALPHLLLGRQLELEGEHEAAMQAFATGLRIEPDNEMAQTLFQQAESRTHVTSAPTQ